MTTSRYLPGCSTWSQVFGEAAGRSPSAWNVNANNGNVNNNHRNNDGFALAVRRVGEFQGAPSFEDLYRAWKRARRQKVPSFNQLQFDLAWSSHLLRLQEQLIGGAWQPRPSTCFIATRPKAREIHAPDFADRVVHHWLVPQLEAIYEPAFIHDSYANRKGRGSHAAVRRLQAFVRQVRSGQGRGWYLQLDVHNFFNSIHRPTLWALLKRRMQRAGLSGVVQRAVHALLRQSPLKAGVRVRATAAERALVPMNKRLECAPADCGLPVGNLSSQFFANVVLNELDQFVKHTLRCQRYLRYVDDFVLVHESREQLDAWRVEIEAFLRDRLQLRLKADQRLKPIDDGIDFLGYVIRPSHTLVRPRVVTHAREALRKWETAHIRSGSIRASREERLSARSIIASYGGHFRHAASHRLRKRFGVEFPWIRTIKSERMRG